MQIRVLGPIEVVTRDGRAAPLGGQRPALLLALLAANAPRALSTGRLADALWGDRQPVNPAAALQSQVSRLRHRLSDPHLIETVAGGYRVAAPGQVDGVVFESLSAEAEGAGPRAALQRLDAALSLWRGSPFGDLGDHEYLRPAAARLEERHTLVAEGRVEALLALGRHGEAVGAALALVGEQPLRERPCGLLMRALVAAGRHADALDAYREFRRTLGEDLGLEPSPELSRLEGRILRHEPLIASAPAPSDRPGLAVPHRLPQFATSFVGRDADMAAVQDLLGDARLVTVVGPGGVGKTRLAIEAARRVPVGRFADGTWLVDLTSVREAAGVTAALAAALEIERQAGPMDVDRLAEALATRCALLLVDNCEHVLGPVAEILAALVSRTMSLSVLATSRERLGIAAERCYPVAPLQAPDGDVAVGSAAELFIERARAASPAFTLDAASEHIVCELCRRLDGLPLAIELTATTLSARTPAEVLADLEARLAVRPARRGAVDRHRSVDAVVAWSYDLLDDADRRLFEDLSVCASGFTRDAAAVIADVPTGEAAARLCALVDRSLVSARPIGTATRYRMLEPIRAYAADRLGERGCAERAGARHATWFTELVEAADVGLRGADEAAWSERLSVDLGNLRAAFRHLIERDDADRCLRLLSPLYWYAWSGAHSEISTWAEDAVQRFGDKPHPGFGAVCAVAAVGAWQRGDIDAARALARRGVDAGDGGNGVAHYALDALGDVSLLAGAHAEAIRSYGQCLARARQAGDTRYVVVGACNVALAYAYSGEVTRALPLADHAREIARSSGNPTSLAFAEFTSGEIRLETAPEEALPLLERAIVTANAARNRFVAGIAGLSAVSVAARIGDPGAALGRYPALLDHWQQLGAWTQQWTTIRTLIETLVRVGETDASAVLLGALRATTRSAPLIGADATRLAAATEVLRARLGGARLEELTAAGAALGDDRAVDFGRRALAAK